MNPRSMDRATCEGLGRSCAFTTRFEAHVNGPGPAEKLRGDERGALVKTLAASRQREHGVASSSTNVGVAQVAARSRCETPPIVASCSLYVAMSSSTEATTFQEPCIHMTS
jgi:hypothetical protein